MLAVTLCGTSSRKDCLRLASRSVRDLLMYSERERGTLPRELIISTARQMSRGPRARPGSFRLWTLGALSSGRQPGDSLTILYPLLPDLHTYSVVRLQGGRDFGGGRSAGSRLARTPQPSSNSACPGFSPPGSPALLCSHRPLEGSIARSLSPYRRMSPESALHPGSGQPATWPCLPWKVSLWLPPIGRRL